MFWPIPQSYSCNLPSRGKQGGFWENRGDRYHCGVDIYAPAGSHVHSLMDGIIVDIGVFTSPVQYPYWNTTYFLVIHHAGGFFARYAEVDEFALDTEGLVRRGDIIARVGQVIEPLRITAESPDYVKKLVHSNYISMLHLELYSSYPNEIPCYMGGNTFQHLKPEFLLNPNDLLSFPQNKTRVRL